MADPVLVRCSRATFSCYERTEHNSSTTMGRQNRCCRHILQFVGDLRGDGHRSARPLAIFAFLSRGIVLRMGRSCVGNHFPGGSYWGAAVTPSGKAILGPPLLRARMSSVSLISHSNASNQAMQPTPGRRTLKISMTPTSSPATTRALASGG